MTDNFDDLEIPTFLRRDPNEPAPSWRRTFPEQPAEHGDLFTSKPLDPATAAVLAEQEASRKIKTQNRIARMLAKKEDHSDETWNNRTAKWEKI